MCYYLNVHFHGQRVNLVSDYLLGEIQTTYSQFHARQPVNSPRCYQLDVRRKTDILVYKFLLNKKYFLRFLFDGDK